MSDYVSEYRDGFAPAVVDGPILGEVSRDGKTFRYNGPIPPASERIIAHIDPDLTVHNVLDMSEVRVTDPETGGMKGQKAEQYSLLPVGALAQVARVYAYGASKYSRQNWRLGYAWHLSYDAMQRHLNAFWGGEDADTESGLPHLAHAVFHALTLLTYMADEKYTGKDDRAA